MPDWRVSGQPLWGLRAQRSRTGILNASPRLGKQGAELPESVYRTDVYPDVAGMTAERGHLCKQRTCVFDRALQ
jgi:hypothetical protein